MEYKLLILPFVVIVLTQIIKMIVDAFQGRFSWKDFDSYGGMPSSHAAFMGAALIESWQIFGLHSSVFAIIAFLTFIVLRDAVGIRMTVGRHASVINRLVKELPDNKELDFPHLEPRQGHTYLQVLVGFVIGIAIAFVF